MTVGAPMVALDEGHDRQAERGHARRARRPWERVHAVKAVAKGIVLPFGNFCYMLQSVIFY